MKKNLYSRLLFLTAFSSLIVGCVAATAEPSSISRELKVKNKKSTPTKNKLTIAAKQSYSKNESLHFSIDTGKEKGYVYIIYIDKKGDTAVLSNNSNKKKKGGKLNFPKDFGNKNIKVSKDCKNCKKEKTTVYVLLSTDPIEDISNMNKNDLLSLNTKQTLHKNRAISLNNENKQPVKIAKVEFFVE